MRTSIIILGSMLAFFFAATVNAQIWTGPSASPPGANTSVPLNSSNVGQSKIGGLILNTGNAEYGLLVPRGKIGFGTLTPGDLFNIFSPSGVEVFKILDNGYTGIGVVSPTSRLSVAGGVQIGDDTAACAVIKTGTMRYHGGVIEVCNGTAWVAAGSSSGSNGTVGGGGSSGSSGPVTGSTNGFMETGVFNPGTFGSVSYAVCRVVDLPGWCDTNIRKAGNYYFFGCGKGYNMNIRYQADDAYCIYGAGLCEHKFITCTRNTDTIGASCPATGGCLATPDGGQCASYSTATATSEGGCSGATVFATCNNGTWSSTSGVSRTCTVGAPPPPPSSTVWGCTDSNANNYNPNATADDGTCDFGGGDPGGDPGGE